MRSNFTDRDKKIVETVSSLTVSITMIVIYIISRLNGHWGVVSSKPTTSLTPLAQDIVAFEHLHPTLSIYMLGLTLCATMLYLVIFTTRRTLYPQGVFLQPIIYTSLAIAMCTLSTNPLITAITIICSMCALADICSVNHTSYAASIYSDTPTSFKSPTSRLFMGAIYMGILSLIHPSTITLVLIFPIVIFCFDRYIYELITPIFAFFIPIAVELYLRWWLYNANVSMLIHRYQSLFEANGEIFATWSDYTEMIQLSYPATFLILLSLILSTLGLARILNYSITARAHQRFVFSLVLFAAGLIMTTLSSFTPIVLLIIAAPVAILITAALINLRFWISIALFAIYILLTIFAIFLNIGVQ